MVGARGGGGWRRLGLKKQTQEIYKIMPLLNVKMIEGVFTPAQKQEMIRKLTDAMVSIEGESLRPYTVVVLEEVKSADWSVGGNSFTTADVKALAASNPKG
jgi:4-oxalocrotonate tautomerase